MYLSSLLCAQHLAQYLALQRRTVNVIEWNELMAMTHDHAKDNV